MYIFNLILNLQGCKLNRTEQQLQESIIYLLQKIYTHWSTRYSKPRDKTLIFLYDTYKELTDEIIGVNSYLFNNNNGGEIEADDTLQEIGTIFFNYDLKLRNYASNKIECINFNFKKDGAGTGEYCTNLVKNWESLYCETCIKENKIY